MELREEFALTDLIIRELLSSYKVFEIIIRLAGPDRVFRSGPDRTEKNGLWSQVLGPDRTTVSKFLLGPDRVFLVPSGPDRKVLRSPNLIWDRTVRIWSGLVPSGRDRGKITKTKI